MPLTMPSHDAHCSVVLTQQCSLPDSAHWPLRCLHQSMLPVSLRHPEHLFHLQKYRPFLSCALTASSWDLPHCLTLALIVYRNDNLWDSQGRCLTSVFHIESSQPGVYLLSLHSSPCSATTVAPEDTAASVDLEGLASSCWGKN